MGVLLYLDKRGLEGLEESTLFTFVILFRYTGNIVMII